MENKMLPLTKGTVIKIIILLLLLITIPLSVKFAQERQIFKSQAAEGDNFCADLLGNYYDKGKSCGVGKECDGSGNCVVQTNPCADLLGNYYPKGTGCGLGKACDGKGSCVNIDQTGASSCTNSNCGGSTCGTGTICQSIPNTNQCGCLPAPGSGNAGGGSSNDPPQYACQTNTSLCGNTLFCNPSNTGQCILKNGGYCAEPGQTEVDIDSNGCVFNFEDVTNDPDPDTRNSCTALGCGGTSSAPSPSVTQQPGGQGGTTQATPTPNTARGGTTGTLSGSCQADPGIPVGTDPNPGFMWKADCSKSCTSNAGCLPSSDSYILSKFEQDTTRWCYGFSGASRCMQIAVKNSLGGSITCEGNPECKVTNFNSDPEHPGMGRVNLNVSWKGIKECQDLGMLGSPDCSYVAAELCEDTNDPQRANQRLGKLISSKGNPIVGTPIFPDGSNNVGPIWWIRPGFEYTYSLWETAYNCKTQECLNEQYKQRACGKDASKSKRVAGAVKKVTTGSAGSTTPSPSQSITPTTSVSVTPSVSPAPSTKTAFYRVSATKFEANSSTPSWEKYENYPQRASLAFSNAKPGDVLRVYAQFQSDAGEKSQVIEKSIKYIGSDPQISNISCGYPSTGTGTEVVISGENFGAKGPKSKVMFNGQNTRISSWDREATSSGVWKVVASISDKLQGNQAIPLSLETDDGRRVPSEGVTTCTINLTTMSFNAKSECRPNTDMSAGNIKVQIKEVAKGAQPIFDQNINLNTEGRPIWSPPVLEVGKKYVATIRGPKTLGHKVEFEAKEGTNLLSEFRMLIGDIAPSSSPDNRVNTLDYSLLLGQWALTKDVIGKSADFNLDKRVNSIDYACLRQNFNKNGEDFPND